MVRIAHHLAKSDLMYIPSQDLANITSWIMHLYNRNLHSWKARSSQRCGGRIQIYKEQTVQGERILPMCGTVNMLSQ